MTSGNPTSAEPIASNEAAGPTFRDAFQGILRLTWSGLLAWRRLPGVLVLVAASPTLAALALWTAHDHRDEGFRMWVMHLHTHFMVPIACLLTGGAMMRDEIQASTLPFLVTRPLSRARLLGLKYLCHVLYLEGMLALNVVLLTLVGLSLGLPKAAVLGAWLLVVQAVMIPAFMAISTVLGLASKRYVMLGVLYGAIVEAGFGQIPTNINVLSLSRHFSTLMGRCPALENATVLTVWDMTRSVLEVGVIGAVALGLGTVLFTYLEFLEADTPK